MATYGRGDFIGQTLACITPQLNDDVELVVVDGASPDSTFDVMAGWAAREPRLRYYREAANGGVDRDFDKAVEYARGDYCWLLSDDDVIASGAVSRVLAMIDDGPDLVVVNAQVMDAALQLVVKARQMIIPADQEFASGADERFLRTAGSYLSFIGAVVMRRSTWLARTREPYYGSLFIHFGVIFQQPPLGRVKLLAEPLITIRYGNAMWTARGYEIWTDLWPRLVWSFEHFSEAARAAVTARYPAVSLKTLLWYRAIGALSLDSLQTRRQGPRHRLETLVAGMPQPVLNALVAVYGVLRGGENGQLVLYELARVPTAPRITRWLARRLQSVRRSRSLGRER